MKKLLLALLSIFIISGMLYSQNTVDENQARLYAQRFAESNMPRNAGRLDLVHGRANRFYIYNIDRQGFVIISGCKSMRPILAYSTKNVFGTYEDAPENLKWWLEQYDRQAAYAMSHPEIEDKSTSALWRQLEKKGLHLGNSRGVSELCKTVWNQDCYYNEYCPYDYSGPCDHVYAGCVACAMAQIMKYHNHPAHGYGSHTYSAGNYGNLTADFGNTTYKWDEMPDFVYGANDAVATLMYHCGISVNMNYSPSGSGAYSHDVETALRSYFGYCGAIFRERRNMTDDAWKDMLKNELSASRPLYYSGNGDSGGHAFVCDGFDDNDYFHFNFGWSGAGNGYYTLDDINGFSGSQTAVINIEPLVINSDENGIIYVTPDGQGEGSSWDNATSLLHYATALSKNGTRIWVKKGVYYGDDNDSVNAFVIRPGNMVYGGFNGDEPADYDLSQRNFTENATILDGRNSKRVLCQSKQFTLANAAVWDGFTLCNGNAGAGAGAFLNDYTTLSNCIITDNHAEIYGGGVYANAANTKNHVFLNNCTIKRNSTSMGGGICDRYSLVLSNCHISNNTATTKGGGIYYYANTVPVMNNCVVSNNTAKSGGGIYDKGVLSASNCNFVMNKATESSGGLYIVKGTNRFVNCIFWGNEANGQPNQYDGSSVFEFCASSEKQSGDGNITVAAENDGGDPGYFLRFAGLPSGTGAEYENFSWDLLPRSICLNAGKPGTSGVGEVDIEGRERVQKDRIEIGAYEICSPLHRIEATIAQGEIYYFNGVPITQDGYYTTAYPDFECDSIVGLELHVTTNVKECENKSIKISPNPASTMIHIAGEGIQAATLYNADGQRMNTARLENRTVDVSRVPNGIYFIRVQTATGIVTEKIIISH